LRCFPSIDFDASIAFGITHLSIQSALPSTHPHCLRHNGLRAALGQSLNNVRAGAGFLKTQHATTPRWRNGSRPNHIEHVKQKRPLMTAMRDMPHVTRKMIALNSWHRYFLTLNITLEHKNKQFKAE